MNRTASCCCAAALLLTAALNVRADWPSWRGPDGLGIAPEGDFPIRWSATENVRWRTPLPQRGNSSPIVQGDKVFVTQAIEDQGRRTLMCFDRADGRLLWQSGTVYNEPEPSHPTNPPCSASPVTDGERVIVSFGSAGVFCYDFEGKELWRRDLGKQTHEWGNAASPVIYRNLCILNFGPGQRTFLIALDTGTGETKWQVDIPPFEFSKRTDGFANSSGGGVVGSWSTPLIVRTGQRDELIMTYPLQVRAYNPLAGTELWRCDGLNPLVYTSPIYGDGVIVAMGGFHGTTLAVRPGGNGDVTGTHRLWHTVRTRNRLGSGVIKDGHLYILNTPGIAECIELETGEAVWDERVRGTGPSNESWASMVLAGDRIYIMNQSGETHVLRASPEFELLAANPVGEPSNSTPAFSGGEVFIRTHEALWCVAKTKRAASVGTNED